MKNRSRGGVPRRATGVIRLSMTVENYLLSIMRLEEQSVRVTLTQLSEHLKTLPVGEGLGTSLPSVGAMIRRMVREGLIEKTTTSKDVVLTEEGRTFAENIVRRHRLAERMVVDLLGLELEKAHIEAHRLEHAISPELEEKIVTKLGNPKTCPFGHPIPRSGYVPNPEVLSLGSAISGDVLIVDRVPEDDQELLEYFVDNELIPGQRIQVRDVAPARGVITIECGRRDLVFSYEIASRIWVRSP